MTERVDASPTEGAEDDTLKRGVQTPGGLPDRLAKMTIGDLIRPRIRKQGSAGRGEERRFSNG